LAGNAGTHTFSAALKTAGTQSITVTDTANGSLNASQTGIIVNPAAASMCVVAGFSSPTTAGGSHNFTVSARDAFGNTATGYAGTVTFSSSDAQAVLPFNYTFGSGDAGVHSFSATLKTAGTQSITATDTTTSTIKGSQTGITVNPAAVSTLLVSGYPSPVSAGVAQTFTVRAQDPFGNTATGYTGTITFTSSDSLAALPGNYTFAGADAGVHTFSATLNTLGVQSITATDTATGSITGTESGITVAIGAASKLVVSGFPSSTTAGVAQGFTVTAEDNQGNVITAYTGTITFTSSDGQAVLPANYTFVSGDAGVHSFTATLKTAGTQSITATDTTTSTVKGSETGITVNAAAASTLTVNGFPSPTLAGVAHTFTVTAKDAFGNTATGYTGAVTFTSTDSQSALPANYTFVNGDAGAHAFSATLKTVGTQSITATDTVTSTIKGSQTGITVAPAAASILIVNGYPSPTTAGVLQNFTVTAKDAFGNLATGYTGTVTCTSSDPQAALPANYTFVSGDAGAHTFTATLKTAGPQSITATDTITSTVKGSQTGIIVNPTAVSTLLVSGYPSATTAGAAHNFTVAAKDAFGNTATSYTGTVTFTSSDAQAVLPANYTFVSGDAGTHAFSATFKTVGAQSLTAADNANSTIKGSQTGIVVNPATSVSMFLVTGFPSPTTAGVSHTFTVTAKDTFGNTVTTYSGTVAFTSTDLQAALPASYTFVAGDTGAHTFSATLKTAATQSITVTDINSTPNNRIQGSQTGIIVNPAAASTFKVVAPARQVATKAFSVTLTAADPFNNTVTSYAGSVHFTSSDPQAVLPADYTFVSADLGVHTFNQAATLMTPGIQTVAATDTSNAAVTGQASMTVLPFLTPVILGRESDNGQIWGSVTNGSNAFNTTSWGFMSTAVTWVDVKTGDFNGDGKTDIVARNQQTGDVWVGISNGSSLAFSLWTTWNSSVSWVDTQVGDFNGDGKADLASRVQSSGQWWVAQSNGSSFTNSLWTTWNPAVTWLDVHAADFNGDGRDDLVGRTAVPSAYQWWLAQSNGSSFANSMWASWSASVTWVDIQVADFNGDGRADLTARASQTGGWWTGLSTGSSFNTSFWASWNPTVSWVDVKVGDFNGDGKTDLIGRVSSSGQWWAAISTGSSFTTSLWATWSTSVTWVDIQVADFNNDGKDDIAGRALESGQWWTGLSTGASLNTTLWATWSTSVSWLNVVLAKNV
jgi:hypothetical protein